MRQRTRIAMIDYTLDTYIRRLLDPCAVFRIRVGYRVVPSEERQFQFGLPDERPLAAPMDYVAGFSGRQYGCARNDRNVRLRRKVRDDDLPLLLGRRDSGDAVRRGIHDAVLLRQQGALGPG